MTKAKKSKGNPKTSAENQFFEIVNWKRAQPTMKAGPNDWMKLYTSLLEHNGFCGMDDSARMLIVALWLYAARSGQHIFPSDPAWLARKIPMLNSKPDLGPLLEAKDICGNPTPFVRYCELPKDSEADPASKGSSAAGKTKKKKKKIVVLVEEKRREEKRREEKKREDKTKSLRISEEKKREEKTKSLRISKEKKRERKERISSEAAQTITTAAQQTKAAEPEKSVSPIDSEAGSAERHILPRPTRSVIRHTGPRSIGSIIGEWIPEHWQDPDAESFGWEIVRALGYSDDQHNLKSRSEWGSFAAWWSKVKKSAPLIMIDELRAKAIRKAVYVRTKGKSARNRSAVWFHIMNGELGQRGVTISHPARASP